MKLTVLCGVKDESCRSKLGAINVPGFPGPEWYRDGNFERLRWDERHYVCPKHGALMIHEEGLLRRALNPGRPVIMATRDGTAV